MPLLLLVQGENSESLIRIHNSLTSLKFDEYKKFLTKPDEIYCEACDMNSFLFIWKISSHRFDAGSAIHKMKFSGSQARIKLTCRVGSRQNTSSAEDPFSSQHNILERTGLSHFPSLKSPQPLIIWKREEWGERGQWESYLNNVYLNQRLSAIHTAVYLSRLEMTVGSPLHTNVIEFSS